MIDSGKEQQAPLSSKRWLSGIIAITVCIRLSLVIITQSWEFDSTRGQLYHESAEIGAALASGLGYSWPANSLYPEHGRPYEPTSWEPPVYSLLIALVFKVFGAYSLMSSISLLVLNIVFSALTGILLFYIGNRVFNKWVGILAAMALAFYPSELHFSVQKVQSTILLEVLLLYLILQLFTFAQTPTVKKSILVGFIFGIVLLTVAPILALVPFAIGWLFLALRSHWKQRLQYIIMVLTALCITLSPWLIRNYIVFDRFVFIKSNLSRELYLGNFEDKKSEHEELSYSATLDEGQKSKVYSQKFFSSILGNPGQLVKKTYSRFVRFWTKIPQVGGPRSRNRSGIKGLISGMAYYFILILGMLGIALTRLKGKEVQLLAIVIFSLPLPYYLTWFSRFRYRFPVEPVLMIFAAFALFQIWIWLKEKIRKPVSA